MTNRVAYLGPPGTFSEEAAIAHDPGAARAPCTTIRAVAAAVEAGQAEEGIVPIENSIEGSVPDTLDLLIHESPLLIRREVVIPITQCLMARPGAHLAGVRTIYSHPNALGQCRRFIERTFRDVQVVAALSTVAAVAELGRAGEGAAAIGPRRAAELHGVQVLAEGIQDQAENVTRFVVLAREDHPPTGHDKTSIAFSFADDKPGELYAALGDFAVRNINLAKVESRPSKESLGRYFFLLDLEGHRLDPLVAEALGQLRARTSMLKMFGSYPRYRMARPTIK